MQVTRGHVTRRYEAVVSVRLRGPSGLEIEVWAALDTGFDGHLSLPAYLVTELRLIPAGNVFAILADESTVPVDLYECCVLWEGQERLVNAYCLEAAPLVGMGMLRGRRVEIDVIPDGPVTITALG